MPPRTYSLAVIRCTAANSLGANTMHSSKKLEIEDDTEHWDWLPATSRPPRGRALAAIVLAASCLTVGILLGVLGESAFRRVSNMVGKTGSDTPRSSQSTDIPPSEPTLALSGRDTVSKPQDAEPKVAVTIINEGASKTQQPRSHSADRPETRATEVLPPEPQDAIAQTSDVVVPRPEARRAHDHESPRERDIAAKPVKKQIPHRTFKNYSDLRNHVLGK
jgi:hypothetical protein